MARGRHLPQREPLQRPGWVRFPDFRIRMRRAQTVRYRYRSGKVTYSRRRLAQNAHLRQRPETSVLEEAWGAEEWGGVAGHPQRAFRPDGLPVPGARSLCDLPALEICEIALTPHIELHFVLKLAGVGFCFM